MFLFVLVPENPGRSDAHVCSPGINRTSNEWVVVAQASIAAAANGWVDERGWANLGWW